MSVTEIARLTCQAGTGDEFAERLKKGLTVQGEDPACLAILFHRGVERPDEFILQLTWTSIDAHKAWVTGNRERWRAHISDLLDGQPQVSHYAFVAQVKG